jgi:hypothetical protein
MDFFITTPPFTQLNTPYPASAYLKGFLNTRGISATQADLGISVILRIFSQAGLKDMFAWIDANVDKPLSDNALRILNLRRYYLDSIDAVMLFLQGKNATLANLLATEDYLPRAARFAQLEDLDWAFGSMGIQDKAKHIATLYLEDISDLVVEAVDAHFGFSRYAERLGRCANSFDELYESLQAEPTYIDKIHLEILDTYLAENQPLIFAQSVPFPGNLYSAFRAAQYAKAKYPNIKTAMGGGFPNTELRSLSDARVMEFFDFITLDDGERPMEQLFLYCKNIIPQTELKRTFLLQNGEVKYITSSHCNDYPQAEVGTPDYTGLPLDKYISVIELANPMHRLWSDGRWNKLTMAHGCYWGKCTFCDISLDYIKVYEPIAAQILCDRIEEMIAQTGDYGFHFVDEAAPPALMRALSIEILRRGLVVSWWTNIRFEKSFTADLCLLLKAAGCVAVSGGLEVASDRLLELIQKGVTVAQVAEVTRNFTEAGIMVHSYLMYGFPTQTAQETIDSLEMVRQMFDAGILQSGFWHQFAMTAHSPVGISPEKFGVQAHRAADIRFADNDIMHSDPQGAQHELFSYGLKKSLFNFMHGVELDAPLSAWFDFKVPRTTIAPNYIANVLRQSGLPNLRPTVKILWLGTSPTLKISQKTKRNRSFEVATLSFHDKKATYNIDLPKAAGEWLAQLLPRLSPANPKLYTVGEIKNLYVEAGLEAEEEFELFWHNKPMNTLAGLLRL